MSFLKIRSRSRPRTGSFWPSASARRFRTCRFTAEGTAAAGIMTPKRDRSRPFFCIFTDKALPRQRKGAERGKDEIARRERLGITLASFERSIRGALCGGGGRGHFFRPGSAGALKSRGSAGASVFWADRLRTLGPSLAYSSFFVHTRLRVPSQKKLYTANAQKLRGRPLTNNLEPIQ